ncbi:MAG TPA: hypothetical protein PKY87_13370 [Terricaulis sp.]|nr:hypothetical protein [Terricaulis sp.]
MDFSFQQAWVSLLTVFLAVLGWLRIVEREEIKALKDEIAATRRRADEAEDALAEHKLYAAEHFARAADVKATVAETEARILREIDTRSAREIALLEEIRAKLSRAN